MLQITFATGNSRGFSLSGFQYSATTFSNFFHLKGVRTVEDFIAVWEKNVMYGPSDNDVSLESPSNASQSSSQPSQPSPSTTPSRYAIEFDIKQNNVETYIIYVQNLLIYIFSGSVL